MNGTSPQLLMYALSASVIGPAGANTTASMRESRTRSADSASRRAKLAPAAEIAGETSAKRADALQVGRGLSSGREGTVANDDHFRVPADTGLVADRPRDVLHQSLELLAFDAGLEVRKPVRRIGGRIRHAVMVQGVAVTPDSEFAHASLLTGVQPTVGIERLATDRGKKKAGTDSLTGTRPARFAMEVAESSVALSHVLDDRLHEDRQRAPPRSRLSRPGLVVGVLLSAFKLRLIGGQPEPIDLDHLTCW